MDNIVDLIATDSSASDISDLIKDALFAKSAEKINSIRPEVASSLFGFNSVGEEE
jgi:hypothetical protein